MNQLTSRRDRTSRRSQARYVGLVHEVSGRDLVPSRPVSDRPPVCALVEEGGPRDSIQRGIESLTDCDDIRPVALPMLAVHILRCAPAVDAQRAVSSVQEPGDAETLACNLRVHSGVPLQLRKIHVDRLQDHITGSPGPALATRYRNQRHAASAEGGNY